MGVILTLLLPALSFAEGSGDIEGYVKDAGSGAPLPGADIVVVGTRWGAGSDESGHFRISNVAAGTYRLKVTRLGYRDVIRQVEVPEGRTVKLGFFLETAILKLPGDSMVVPVGMDIFDTSVPRAVIDREELKELNPITVAEALENVPGISMARPGSWGMKPVIQGLKDDRIVVLVDGARLNQACPLGMDACVATIDPDLIERIEVIKGPNSVAFGSGNLGGVINIITKKPPLLKGEGFEVSSGLSAGYYSASAGRIGRLNLGGGFKGMDFLLGTGSQNYEDYKTARGTVPNSGFSSRDLDVKVDLDFRQHQRLQLTGQFYDGRDIGYPASSAVIPREERRQYTVNYSTDRISERVVSLDATLALQRLSHNMEIRAESGEALFRGDSDSDTYSWTVKGQFPMGASQILTLGLDYYRWNMKAARGNEVEGAGRPLITTLPNAYQWDAGLFAEGKVPLRFGFDLNWGIRADRVRADADSPEDPEAGGGATTTVDGGFIGGNLGLLYRISDGVRVSASWGRGFKPATPVERYLSSPMSDGYQYVGTPDLEFERSHTFRLGAKGMTARLRWDVAMYRNNLANLISVEVDPELSPPDPGLMGVKHYVNLGNATIRGLESSGSLSLTRTVSLGGSLTYTRGEESSTGRPLPQIPPLEGDVNLRYRQASGTYRLEIVGRIVGDQNRYDADAGEVRTPGFATFDFRAGARIFENLEFNLAVENIANRGYRQHLNLARLPEPGRNLYLGLSMEMPLGKGLFRRGGKSETETQRVTLHVEGMYCKFCVQTVRSVLGRIDGVKTVDVDLEMKRAIVVFDKGKTSVGRIVRALSDVGYNVSILEAPEGER